MLMLYVFKVEVFDLTLNYSYSTDCVVIADTREDRQLQIQRQFGSHNSSTVKRSILLGARALSCSEVSLLERSAGTTGTVWLATRVRPWTPLPPVRHLPRLESDEDMYELMERAPESYDSSLLMPDQYVHSNCFSQRGPVAASLSAAA